MTNVLKDKTILITGGAKGYGLGMTETFAKAGADVWITGRDEEALRSVADEFNVNCIKADVKSGDDWDRVFETILKQSSKVDILINNAGAGISISQLDEMTDEAIAEVLNVNLLGATLGCARAATVMKEQKFGTIINISSICQKQAWPGWSVYSAAKAGLAQLSNCLYTELRPYGVKVTQVIPSWGATDFNQSAGLDNFDEELANQVTQLNEFGEFIAQLCQIPSHLAVQEVTLLPLVQAIEPL